MKGHIGAPCGVYGYILPGVTSINKIYKLSNEAKARVAWIDFYLKHKNARLTCRRYGLNPKLFYKWKNRFDRIGIKGLENLSRRPHRFRQSKIPIEWISTAILLRKRYPYYSKFKLSVMLERDYNIKLSPSSIGRIIKRHNLFPQPVYASKKVRYRRARLPKEFTIAEPGDLVQRDTKHIPFLGKRRYCFVAIDCKGKGIAVKVSSTISSHANREFSNLINKTFPFAVKNQQNDNGSENLGYTYQHLKDNNIPQYFSHPSCPKENSFVERVIGTIEREFVQQGKLAASVEEQQKLIDQWLNEYHNIRPHQSLHYQTPNEYYKNTIGKTINVLPML